MTPAQLTERLKESGESATKKLLKELGFDKPEALKDALNALKQLQDADKSEKQKLEELVAALTPKAARTDTVTAMLASLVEERFNALPEKARQAIDAVANGDPDKRLELIRVFGASGLLEATSPPPAPPAPPGPPAAPPVPPPAHITPPPAPAPSGTQTKFQEWETVKAKAPMLGDIFYEQHKAEIERTRPAA